MVPRFCRPAAFEQNRVRVECCRSACVVEGQRASGKEAGGNREEREEDGNQKWTLTTDVTAEV